MKGGYIEAKKKKCRKEFLNNQIFCSRENLACFISDLKVLSGFPFFWLEKRRENVLPCLILSLLVKSGLKNHKYDHGPINFIHKAYTPLENISFQVHCFFFFSSSPLFFQHHWKEFKISSKAPASPSKLHIPKAKFSHTSQGKGTHSPERKGRQLLRVIN